MPLSTENNSPQNSFNWGLYPQIEIFLTDQIKAFFVQNPEAHRLATKIEQRTSTFFLDWIDHIIIPEDKVQIEQLESYGYFPVDSTLTPDAVQGYWHQKSTFFPILLSEKRHIEFVLKPERLDHFLQMIGKKSNILGAPYSPLRYSQVIQHGNCVLSAMERRGSNQFFVSASQNDNIPYQRALDRFIVRQRNFDSDCTGVDAIFTLLKDIRKHLSPARMTDAFFRAERQYWERSNRAGQLQKNSQDHFGLGWGNHDHHTYRSSRGNYQKLIQLFDYLGFHSREQFFAGEKAGWGAQVLEHPINQIVLFVDVDLTADERSQDFVHTPLEDRIQFNTVGLWVALHGESILQAGLHHLAVRLNFTQAQTTLKTMGIKTLPAFSNFTFLKQAFTEAQHTQLDPSRIQSLFHRESITPKESAIFGKEGGLHTHLENIQRNQGFKGFNQDSVSAIITALDPRTN